MAEYYKYKIPESYLTMLIGNNKQQIIETMEFYHGQEKSLKAPDESQIHKISSLEIRCGLPLMMGKFFFKAQITDFLALNINANAVDYIQGATLGYWLSKRGSLYKFEPGLPEFGLYFLPEDLMVAIKNYDWGKHKEIMDEWKKLYDSIDFGKHIITAKNIKKDN